RCGWPGRGQRAAAAGGRGWRGGLAWGGWQLGGQGLGPPQDLGLVAEVKGAQHAAALLIAAEPQDPHPALSRRLGYDHTLAGEVRRHPLHPRPDVGPAPLQRGRSRTASALPWRLHVQALLGGGSSAPPARRAADPTTRRRRPSGSRTVCPRPAPRPAPWPPASPPARRRGAASRARVG